MVIILSKIVRDRSLTLVSMKACPKLMQQWFGAKMIALTCLLVQNLWDIMKRNAVSTVIIQLILAINGVVFQIILMRRHQFQTVRNVSIFHDSFTWFRVHFFTFRQNVFLQGESLLVIQQLLDSTGKRISTTSINYLARLPITAAAITAKAVSQACQFYSNQLKQHLIDFLDFK